MKKKYVAVKFENFVDGPFDFITDIDLQPGDVVVCDTRRGKQVATVVASLDYSDKADKWIIQKVDMNAHLARLAREQQLQDLLVAMDSRKVEFERFGTFRAIAANGDSEMSKLLKQFDDLMGYGGLVRDE